MSKELNWVNSDDTGISSKTIWSVMVGAIVDKENIGHCSRFDIPYDPADFGRCHRLLIKFPHWKYRLQEVADIFPKWQPFVDNWDKMTALFIRDEPTGKSAELYKFMKTLRV